MCIIVVKPAGKARPDVKTLGNCMDNNPDGAGYMFSRKGKVVIRKGFFSLTPLLADYYAMGCDDSDCVVFHFRIGTAGNNDQGNCHPFPVCGDYKEMRKVENKTDHAIAHNGILFGITPENGLVSDTMTFVKLMLNAEKKLLYKDKLRDIMEHLIESGRVAYMNGAGRINMFGSGWESFEGCFYSNDAYKRSKWKSMQTNEKTYHYPSTDSKTAKREDLCTECDGHGFYQVGATNWESCQYCNGTGFEEPSNAIESVEDSEDYVECPACEGTGWLDCEGEIEDLQCGVCDATGYMYIGEPKDEEVDNAPFRCGDCGQNIAQDGSCGCPTGELCPQCFEPLSGGSCHSCMYVAEEARVMGFAGVKKKDTELIPAS